MLRELTRACRQTFLSVFLSTYPQSTSNQQRTGLGEGRGTRFSKVLLVKDVNASASNDNRALRKNRFVSSRCVFVPVINPLPPSHLKATAL